jgi:putative transposase
VRETRRKQDPTRASRRDGPTWAKFPRSRARAILAAGFFTVSLLDGTTVHVLAVTGHATRRIRILGSTACPAGARTTQQARNLLTDPDDAAEKTGFLIRDRDARFTAAFHAVFQSAGIRIITSPVQAPGRTRSWSDA